MALRPRPIRAHEERGARRETIVTAQDPTRPTALVISSYSDLAREFGRRLVAEGYGVRLATDPMQALVLLETDRPSVILLARQLLPVGGLMFLRVLRAHTDVKTVPCVAIGVGDGLPAAVLREAQELGLLDRLPSVGETWSVDRRGTARPQSPTTTLTDTGKKIPVIGPIAIVQTMDGSVPLSIESATSRRMDVLCGRNQLFRGDTLRMVVQEQFVLGEEVQEVNLRVLAEVSGVQTDPHGERCTLQIAAASPPEEYDEFVRYLASR
jgi:CheY-like chemotaxis protein